MRKFVFCTVCLTGWLGIFNAFAAQKPTVKATRVEPRIIYEISKPETACKDIVLNDPTLRGHQDGGCTVPEDWIGEADVDCAKKQISFTFGFQKFTVQIANRFKKGTVIFDQILKHESTHVSLYRKTTEKFYQPVARALLMQYERSEKNGKSCPYITADIKKLFYKYMKLLWKEQKRQNDLIDGIENYEYQDNQVYMMHPPKVEYTFAQVNFSFMAVRARSDSASGRIIIEIILSKKDYFRKEKILKKYCKEIEAKLAELFKIRRNENKTPEEFMEEAIEISKKMMVEKLRHPTKRVKIDLPAASGSKIDTNENSDAGKTGVIKNEKRSSSGKLPTTNENKTYTNKKYGAEKNNVIKDDSSKKKERFILPDEFMKERIKMKKIFESKREDTSFSSNSESVPNEKTSLPQEKTTEQVIDIVADDGLTAIIPFVNIKRSPSEKEQPLSALSHQRKENVSAVQTQKKTERTAPYLPERQTVENRSNKEISPQIPKISKSDLSLINSIKDLFMAIADEFKLKERFEKWRQNLQNRSLNVTTKTQGDSTFGGNTEKTAK